MPTDALWSFTTPVLSTFDAVQQLLPQLHQLAWELRRPPLPLASSAATETDPLNPGLPSPSADAARQEHPASAQPLRGAELLRTLQRHALNGQPALQAVFQRLQWHCHQVLFQQLTAW